VKDEYKIYIRHLKGFRRQIYGPRWWLYGAYAVRSTAAIALAKLRGRHDPLKRQFKGSWE
jgi:hypothetical protein